jgi:hypothetical protein
MAVRADELITTFVTRLLLLLDLPGLDPRIGGDQTRRTCV